MKNKIFAIIILAIILAILLWLFPLSPKSAPAPAVAGTTCNDRPDYFVVSREHADTDQVGNDILVKYKTSQDQTFACAYVVEKTDFEIKNEEPQYFLALEGHSLILDSGTGPDPRGLIVYDLSQRQKIYQDLYSGPVETENNAVTYWSPVDTKVTSGNCPELEKYTGEGLGAGLESRITLDLTNLTKKDLGESRCAPRQ